MKATIVRRLTLVGMMSGAMALSVRAEGEEKGAGMKLDELAAQLELVALRKQPYLLELSSEADKTYVIKYVDVYTGKRRSNRSDYIPAGDGPESVFFKDRPAKGKFRLVSVDQQQVQGVRAGFVQQQAVATIEVVKGPKTGMQHKVASRNKKFIVREYKAVLVSKVPGQVAHQFDVMDGERFSLPYHPDAKEKPFTFQKVNEDGAVVIEWEMDGKVGRRVIGP